MSKFRVAIFTGNYNHIRDGVALTLNRLVEFLMKHDVEVLVFGPSKVKPEVSHVGTFISVPSKPAPGRPEYRLSTGFPSDAQAHLENFKPDIIHLATPDYLGYKALKWAKKKKIPIVASYHTHFPGYLKYYNFQWLEPLGWKYLRWFYSHCSQIYVPTSSMAEELKWNGIEKGLVIWARGVDTKLFNPVRRSEAWRNKNNISSDDIAVLFVSRLVWEKNLKMFADVLVKLQTEYANVKALVVGSGPAG
ncbi:MAG: glycosyltransferase, partial [Balneolaceae bacterium]